MMLVDVLGNGCKYYRSLTRLDDKSRFDNTVLGVIMNKICKYKIHEVENVSITIINVSRFRRF